MTLPGREEKKAKNDQPQSQAETQTKTQRPAQLIPPPQPKNTPTQPPLTPTLPSLSPISIPKRPENQRSQCLHHHHQQRKEISRPQMRYARHLTDFTSVRIPSNHPQ